jgi:hypothetical protein
MCDQPHQTCEYLAMIAARSAFFAAWRAWIAKSQNGENIRDEAIGTHTVLWEAFPAHLWPMPKA